MMPNSTQPLNITTEGNNTSTSDKVASLVENQSESNIQLNSGVINDKSITENYKGKVDGTEIESTPTTITTVSSQHENDTDFEVSKTAETSTSCSTEESLPTIRRPKTQYQFLMERRATEDKAVKNENEIENSEENTQQENTQQEDTLEGNDQSAEDSRKSEISDEVKGGISNAGDQSEITEEGRPTEDIAEETEKKKSSKNKSGRSKVDEITLKSRADAYMEQRSINHKVEDDNQNESVNKSEISESNRRMQTRSQSQVELAGNENIGDETKSVSEKDDEEDEDYFSCKICLQSFKNHNMFKKHKVTCTKIKKKHACSKCGKKFSQPSLLTQHFNYRHTDKPKKFVCTPCGKSFELKKTLQEHNHQLHDANGNKYLCDFCSRLFWHLGKFMVHRASHTGVKPFKCGRCGQRSFASSERLTKHFKICSQSNTVECNKCGKGYSNLS